MGILSTEAIAERIQRGDIAPAYLLHGDEFTLIKGLALDMQRWLVPEGQRVFNLCYIEKVAGLRCVDLISRARQFPAGGGKYLLLVDHAEDMRELTTGKGLDALRSYLKSPVLDTVIVFCFYGSCKWDSPFYQLMKDDAIIFHAKKWDADQTIAWMIDRGRQNQIKLSPTTASLLYKLIDSDLWAVGLEIEKLALYCGGGGHVVSEEDIYALFGSSHPISASELQDALAHRDISRIAAWLKTVDGMSTEQVNNQLLPMLTLFWLHALLLTKPNFVGMSDIALSNQLEVPVQAVSLFRIATTQYSPAEVRSAILAIYRADQQTKGIESSSLDTQEVVLELMWGMLCGSRG